MLTITLDEETGILEVIETLMSFTSTHSNYWYTDTRNWLQSSHGKQGDTPDRPMNARAIEWAKKHYLPRAKPRVARVA